MDPAGYYEGILQIRKPTKELIHFIEAMIDKDKKTAVLKKQKVTNGYDYYITNQHYLQNLGKKINNHFFGDLKVSRRLHSQDRMTSRLLYRINVLFTLHHLKVGDNLNYKGKKLKITQLGSKIQAFDTETGKRMIVPYSDLK